MERQNKPPKFFLFQVILILCVLPQQLFLLVKGSMLIKLTLRLKPELVCQSRHSPNLILVEKFYAKSNISRTRISYFAHFLIAERLVVCASMEATYIVAHNTITYVRSTCRGSRRTVQYPQFPGQ